MVNAYDGKIAPKSILSNDMPVAEFTSNGKIIKYTNMDTEGNLYPMHKSNIKIFGNPTVNIHGNVVSGSY